MTDPVDEPWVTAAELRDWMDPTLRYAVEDDPEADRLILRATSLVLDACTAVPDRTKYRQREAVQEAIKLTVEQRVVVGVTGSVAGAGRITIGQVSYGGGTSGSSQQADAPPPDVPAAALYKLRAAGLISTAVVAY